MNPEHKGLSLNDEDHQCDGTRGSLRARRRSAARQSVLNDIKEKDKGEVTWKHGLIYLLSWLHKLLKNTSWRWRLGVFTHAFYPDTQRCKLVEESFKMYAAYKESTMKTKTARKLEEDDRRGR